MEQGNASGHYNLGLMYDLGDGVPGNDAEAARWYRLAAKQGNALAPTNLGIMYANGEGFPFRKLLRIRFVMPSKTMHKLMILITKTLRTLGVGQVLLCV